GRPGGEDERRWGVVFAIASLMTPLLLGTAAGAIASGALGDGGRESGDFYHMYVARWLNPFALSVGLFALIAFAFLAAVYLTLEARERELQDDFRRRALASGAGLFLAAVLALLLSLDGAPRVRDGLIFAAWAVPLHLLTAVAAVSALVALWVRRWGVARVAAAAQVSLILWGWALSQYPYIVPPTFRSPARPRQRRRSVSCWVFWRWAGWCCCRPCITCFVYSREVVSHPSSVIREGRSLRRPQSNTRRATHQAARPPAMKPRSIPHTPNSLSPSAPTSVATTRLTSVLS